MSRWRSWTNLRIHEQPLLPRRDCKLVTTSCGTSYIYSERIVGVESSCSWSYQNANKVGTSVFLTVCLTVLILLHQSCCRRLGTGVLAAARVSVSRNYQNDSTLFRRPHASFFVTDIAQHAILLGFVSAKLSNTQ